MKNRHLIKQGATAVALAMILGFPAAQSAEVYLQAEEYQKVIPYGSGAGVPSYSIAVANASFENPDCSLPGCTIDAVRGNYLTGTATGWVVTGAAGVYRPTASRIIPTDGAQVGYSNGGQFVQTLSAELMPNTTYTLSVDIGDRTDSGFGSYVISLSADGTILVQDNNSLPAPTSGWITSTITYTSGTSIAPGQMLEITLDGNGAQEEFDNIRLDAVSLAATVTMWGYSDCNADFSSCGEPSSPGPQITVPAGDTGLSVTVRNTLPEATSIMIAGQANAPLTAADMATARVDGRLTSFVPAVPAASPAVITQIAINNAGFEDPVLADGGFNSFVNDWTGSGGGTFNPTATQLPGEASEGSNTHYNNGVVPYSQTLTETLAAGTYTLRVDVGDRADTNFPGYQVQLGVDNGGFALLAEDNNSLVPSNGFLTSTVSYDAQAGDANMGLPLVIRLIGAGTQVNFDNVRLEVVTGAATVSTGTYSWPTLKSGSYLYHSGSHVQLQVHMGLYGAMVQDAGTCNSPAPCAYSDASYDAQEVLVFSEIDPALHDPMPKPANATVNGYRPQFFLVNGEPYDGTAPAAIASGGDNVLLRLINAGIDNRSVQLLGGHFQVLAEDGRRLPTTKSQANALLPAAKSLDVMFTPTASGTYPLFDRRGKLVNGPVHGGGMFHQIVVE